MIVGAALVLLGAAVRERKNQEKSRRMPGKILGMLLLLCVFLAGYGRTVQAFRQDEKMEMRLPETGDTLSAEGRISEIRETDLYLALTVETEELGKILVYTKREGEEEKAERQEEMGYRLGQKVLAWGEFSRIEPAGNPGQFDLKRYYRARGITGSLFAKQTEVRTEDEGWPYVNGLYQIRRYFCRVLEQICLPEDLGLFQAVLLGEKEEMDPEISELYQKTGISHLLAISGLHLSILGMGFYRILRRAGAGFWGAGLICGFAVVSYGILTGSSGSALRAVIMLSLSFLAAALGRTYDLLTALSLAALMLLWGNPFLLGECGFQLSFGAVLGIGMAGERLKRGLAPKKGIQENLIVSIAIQLVTAPLVLWHFYAYPIYGILLNLIVIPFSSYLLLSGLAGMALGSFSIFLGQGAVGSGHYILSFYQWISTLFLNLPGSSLLTGRPSLRQLGAYGGAVLVLLGAVGMERKNNSGKNYIKNGENDQKSGENHRDTPEKRRIKWMIFLLGSAGCFTLLLPSGEKELRICFLDVGQGDGAVIQCGSGEIQFTGLELLDRSGEEGAVFSPLGREIRIMIDGGSSSDKNVGENRLKPYLNYMAIDKVDVILVSHGDQDHMNGILYLLDQCPEFLAGCLVLPEAGRGDEAYEELKAAAKRRQINVWYMDGGDQIKAGDLLLTCLYPGKGQEINNPDRNRQSLVIAADYGDYAHFLFTGDTDQECEKRILERTDRVVLEQIQVLKAAHHGSRLSSGEEFLEAISPQAAVLSYGEGNSYGHPHQETISRLESSGARILSTGRWGAVTFQVREGRLWYQLFRKPAG